MYVNVSMLTVVIQDIINDCTVLVISNQSNNHSRINIQNFETELMTHDHDIMTQFLNFQISKFQNQNANIIARIPKYILYILV